MERKTEQLVVFLEREIVERLDQAGTKFSLATKRHNKHKG
jgi:hypothetical protein